MVLESTVVCVDNSEYMRNGDFIPTRLQAQQEAVSLVCHSKTRSNPENNVGLLTLASSEVLATLTTDVGRLLSKLHQVQPKGDINFLTAIRIAHLVLKHRQGKNHKMRIVVFVGSPIETDSKELTKLAKRLKKEKVNVDIVNFGEDNINTEKLATFINTLNGKDGSGSHLVTVPPGHQTHLSDALISSPVIQGEDGTGGIGLGVGGFEFGVDPNEDPELALALRVSMEEQRQRQEDEARRAAANSAKQATQAPTTETESGSSEERLLERALAMSMETDPAPPTTTASLPDFSAMTEDEQIAYAMQMSLQQAQSDSPSTGGTAAAVVKEEPMETEESEEPKKDEAESEDYEMIRDPAFLLYVLENLPGVDPQSETVRNALGELTQGDAAKKDKGAQDKGKSSKDKQ
ncbi:26S proteasome non-ATPase regulatory subunit 4-like isoform X1 [Dermacentor albipictus]|uniref:26S proteasome non-ATPase regulatory subunit 4-like isoform X1 n=2 Tax=Dermacentor albipictus TaxID=60249 RepID=UPI0031FC5866